jgi:hypothetical protein
VVIGDSGFPSRVRTDSRPDQDYLAAQPGPGELIMSGRRQRWEFAGMITDVDESEARYAVVDHPHLEYTVRNSFSGHWLQRHMVVNTSSATVRIDRLVLAVPPAEGCVGWASVAGGDAYWSVQPEDGLGPLLIGELVQGTLVGTEPDDRPGFATGAIMLPANRRFVLQWRIETATDAAAVVRSRQPRLSHRIEHAVNEPYEIPDPDTAVVVDDPLLVSTEGDVQLITSDQPGRYLVELRSGRGTSRLDLAWVPSVEDVITDLSRSWLGGRRSRAGVGVLPGPGAALGLQQAVIGRLTDDLDDAEDALALHTVRLLEQDSLSIMDQAFLAQETVRTGDPEPLSRARGELLAIDRPRPGLGLAATRLCLAELALGGAPSEVITRLHDLAVVDEPPSVTGDHLLGTAARLELITVTGPSAGRTSDDVITDALAVGAQLGSGLLGHRLGRLRPSVAIYAAAVLDLMPDTLGAELERHWGITAHGLADRTRTAALAAVLYPADAELSIVEFADTDEIAEAVGWLVLGRPVE